MSYLKNLRFLLLTMIITLASCSAPEDSGAEVAADDPRHVRHELMEDVGKAAKPLGKMLKGEIDYDADVVMASLQTWHDVSTQIGDLFPAGTETGMDTEAAPAIWEDRAGFDEAIVKWRTAVEAAQAAAPATLEAAKTTVGPVFQTCKGCHDTYRIED